MVDLFPPAVAAWGPNNRLDIFAVGNDYWIYQKTWDGINWIPPKTDWVTLIGIFLSGSAVAWGPNNRLDIFGVQDDDNNMYHKAWDDNTGTWDPPKKDWESLGGNFKLSD